MSMVVSTLSLIFMVPAVTALLYLAEKKWSAYSALSPKLKTWIVGVIYGLVAVYFTEVGGTNIGTAVVNSRDAAAIVAAFCFYPEAGMIAGLIGGIERYFAAYWGVGVYSHTACAIATIFAGFFSYYLSKNIFTDEKPKMMHGLIFGLFIESFHLLVTIFTHADDIRGAFSVLYTIFIWMYVANMASISLSFAVLNIFEGANPFFSRSVTIRRQINYRLIVMMFFVVASIVIIASAILDGLVEEDTAQTLRTSIDSIRFEIDKAQAGSGTKSIQGIAELSQTERSGFAVVYSDDMSVISGVFGRKNLSMDSITDKMSLALQKEINEYEVFNLDIEGVKYYAMYSFHRNMHIFVCIPVLVAEFAVNSAKMLFVLMQVLSFALLFVLINDTTNKIVLKKLDTVVSNLRKISKGDLDVVMDIRGNTEFITLSNGINVTVDKLKDMIKEVTRRIDEDIKIARDIQASSLPSVFPPFPDRDEFDIYASMKAAKGIGGDLYDFFFTDRNKLYLMIADVSGKGIPAALFMMRTQTLIRSLSEKGVPISELLREANNDLIENNGAGLFVTALIACVDLTTGEIRFANAGHNPPILKHADGSCEYLKLKRGFIIAGMPGSTYLETSMNLAPGDTIFMYTDGVTEGINSKEEQYGEKRLIKLIAENNGDPTQLCELVGKDVKKFAGNVPQFDDVTMLCFRLNHTVTGE